MLPRQSPLQVRLGQIVLLAAAALLCLSLTSDAGRPGFLHNISIRTRQRMLALPNRTLWAWERPEDLRAVDPKTTAIASLDQTILIGSDVRSKPRRQPVAINPEAARISVVRIEIEYAGARSGAQLDDHVQQVVRLLLNSASKPGIAALQVDFDATRSQRAFYRRVLFELRAQMPPDLPLSITALASWCSYDDWIGNLPVDEAVPMMFRMEPDRRRVSALAPEMRIREPLCMGSVGISTREPWPADLVSAHGKRIYIFPDRGWHSDLTLLADRNLP